MRAGGPLGRRRLHRARPHGAPTTPPHLYEIYLDAPAEPRELDVLHLAGQGSNNASIARELFISVATVRKYMEHVFDRTGVRSMTEAAALVVPHHSVVDPHWGEICARRPAGERSPRRVVERLTEDEGCSPGSAA